HAVGGEQIHRLRALAGEELAYSGLERELAQTPGESFVDDLKGWVEARGKRMRAQHACAEAVEGADEGRLRVAGRLAVAELQQTRPHAGAQLARGALGEGDREDP